jgi:phosphopantothenoylcysteine decarboxylase/phosphopantothenate--cysteine ligase
MNVRMWEGDATRANVALLRQRGVEVLEPGEGALASRGEHGRGRMPEPAEILAAIEATLASPPDLTGKRVLVTAGGTREAIDPVRFIGNRSSGRMGIALAEAAARRGADVTLVAANVALPATGVERVDVSSAAELEAATRAAFTDADILLMAAAVADFRPAAPNEGKLAREQAADLSLALEPTADVLAGLAADRRDGQVLVGFAAEHGGDFVARARGKLERKGIDAIVVNDVSDSTIGFESGDNEVTVVSRSGDERLPRGSKRKVADAILDRVAELP